MNTSSPASPNRVQERIHNFEGKIRRHSLEQTQNIMDTSIVLSRMLGRIDSNLSSAEYVSRLRTSRSARSRVNSNLENARLRLSNLERQSTGVRSASEKQKLVNDLQKSRENLGRLDLRLREISEAATDDAEEDDDDDSEQEEEEEEADSNNTTSDPFRNPYAPAIRDVNEGLDTGESQPPPYMSTPDASTTKSASATTQSELRSRKPLSVDSRQQATTSAREELFKGRSQKDTNNANLSHTETLMSHNRQEQENLTASLLGLAKSLKESSLGFASSLEADKEAVRRAEGSLDKSAQSMDAAGKKMSTLRRMSEGQGWWGRLKLYGMIFGLWVACFLVVFIGPKLRF